MTYTTLGPIFVFLAICLCRCQSQNQGQSQSVQQKQQTDLYLLGNTNTSIPCGLFNSSLENCDGSMSIQWWDYRSSDAGALIANCPIEQGVACRLATGYSGQEATLSVSSKMALVFSPLNVTYGGQYACVILTNNVTTGSRRFNVSVFDAPGLTSGVQTVAGQHMLVTCTASYSGPRVLMNSVTVDLLMILHPSARSLLVHTSSTTSATPLPNTLAVTISKTFSYTSSEDDDGDMLICYVFVKQNLPTNLFPIRSYAQINVSYPVHDVSISSVQGDGQTIYDSDDLYCQALGNPPPSFSWTQISDGGKQMTTMGVSMASGGGAITSVNGSTVPASLLHNMTTWRCTATNMVNGVRTSVSANIGPLVIVAVPNYPTVTSSPSRGSHVTVHLVCYVIILVWHCSCSALWD